MSIVSSTGLGSGIDINTLVSQLVSAEGQPAYNAIKRQQDAANGRLSGLGTLKSALSDFQSAVSKLKDGSVFTAHKATSSDETLLKVTTGTGAVAGSYSIEVSQLAKAQKSITSAEFANSSALVGSGKLSFSSGSGTSFTVIADASTTLTGLRDAINRASGNNFVSASIVNVDNAAGTGTISKLVLTSKNTGTASSFTVADASDPALTDDGTGLSRFFTTRLTNQTIASDAKVKIDGQTATRSSNLMTDVLPGVTLDLQKAAVGTSVNVNVNLDTDAIKKTISDFVTAYNKLNNTTKDLGKYGGNSDGTGNGALIGDATLRYVKTQVRQSATNIVSSASSSYNSLAMIGIKVDKDGVMSLDSSKLGKALTDNLQSVSDVFSSTDGVATRLSSRLSQYLQSGGPLDSQQTSLKKQLSSLDDKKSDVQARLDNLQKVLQKQFTAMDVAVGQFNSTGSYLNNWINSL